MSHTELRPKGFSIGVCVAMEVIIHDDIAEVYCGHVIAPSKCMFQQSLNEIRDYEVYQSKQSPKSELMTVPYLCRGK